MRPLALAAAMLVLAACPEPSPVEESPDPSVDTAPASAALAGTYHVTSHFEVPAAAAAPGPLGDALRTLHELSVNPAGGLLDLAEAAGTPALEELRAVLPGSLQDEVEGWMNEYLESATVNGISPHDEIAALDAQVRSVLLAWDLRSTLDLPAAQPGTHAPVALVFVPAGDPVVVPVDATAPVTAATAVTATVTWPEAGGPRVAIGDHAMGIPFGHYALVAVDAVLERQLGAPGIGAALDAAVDCAGMAASVADRCIGFLCVGHEAELAAVCEAGVDEAAARIEEQILASDFQAIRFASGAAVAEGVVVDAGSGTATATALSSGVWTATVDLGQEPEAANATFTAVR